MAREVAEMSEENAVRSQRRETIRKLEAPTSATHSKEDRIQTEKKCHWSCYRARKIMFGSSWVYPLSNYYT